MMRVWWTTSSHRVAVLALLWWPCLCQGHMAMTEPHGDPRSYVNIWTFDGRSEGLLYVGTETVPAQQVC